MPRKKKKEEETPTEETVEETEEQSEEVQTEEEQATEKVKEEVKEPQPTITLKLESKQRKALRLLLDMMTELGIDDATFHYDGNLNLRQMNPSRVAMVVASIDLGKGLNGDVKRNFTMSIDGLAKALKLDEPTIVVETAEAKITGKVGYSEKSAIVTLPLLEVLVEEVPIPKVDLQVATEIDISNLKKALNVLAEEPNHLIFESQAMATTIRGKGDFSSIEINGFKSAGEGKATYTWDYLKALKKEKWKLQFATDVPMKASRTITDYHYEGKDRKRVEERIAEVVMWLAPRIEVD